MKYRKKPVVIDAIRWMGGEYDCLMEFCGRNWARADNVDMADFDAPENVVIWNAIEKQWLHCPVGHWIIRGIKGELYSCEDTIFAATYEPAA